MTHELHLDAAILRKGGHAVSEIASEIGITTHTVRDIIHDTHISG